MTTTYVAREESRAASHEPLGVVFRSTGMDTLGIGFIVSMAILPLFGAGGCSDFAGIAYSYRSVEIQTNDARTGQPIANARMRAVYPVIYRFPMPKDTDTLTDSDGRAVFKVADHWKEVMIYVAAPGYASNDSTGCLIADLRGKVFERASHPMATVRIRFFGAGETLQIAVEEDGAPLILQPTGMWTSTP